MSYRLDVFSDSVAEAVAHAGGLIFDRRRAGWDVSVWTSDVTLTRALTILGARIKVPGPFAEPRGAFARNGAEPSLTRMGQVLLWGHHCDDGLDESVTPAHHTLSSAARAFKGYALRAAEWPPILRRAAPLAPGLVRG